MRRTRLFVPLPLERGQELALPEGPRRHLLQVLRARPGQALVLFNGEGGEFHGELVSASKREARVHLVDFDPVDRESPLDLALAQGVARGTHMDLALQKATELGVRRILPLVCRRSVLPPHQVEKKMAHWQGVIIAACEQSGRTRLPELAPPRPLDIHAEALAGAREIQALLLHPGEQPAAALLDTLDAKRPIQLLIGPEGGFDAAERERLRAAGARALGLGPRVLRTETAALAGITLLQHRLGDLG